MGQLAARVSARMRAVPTAFLGMAFFRAWISVFFTESAVPDAGLAFWGGLRRIDVFDISCAAVMLACALLFRRIGTLYDKPVLRRATAAAMWALSLCVAARYILGAAPCAADIALAAGCGASFGLTILLWVEAYACLSPTNLALAYAASLVLEQFLIFMVTHYETGFALLVAAFFPLVAALCHRRAIAGLAPEELPRPTSLRFGFPWKIVCLLALFSFVQGMVATYSSAHGPAVYLGILLPACVVLASCLLAHGRFDFHAVYQWFLPLMAACIVASIPLQAAGHEGLAGFFSIAANRTVVILMFVVLCGMVRTYRLSAIMLFGVERPCMLAASLAGRALGNAGGLTQATQAQVLAFTLLAAALMAVFLYLFYSERYLSSTWGVTFKEGEAAGCGELAAVRALDLARACSLSERETDVLLAVVRGATIKQMEDELQIANGTVKAHLQHVYRKVGVHSKRELCDLVGVQER